MPATCQQVEHPELPLPESLVETDLAIHAGRHCDDLGSSHGPHVGRHDDDVRPLVLDCQPAPERLGLLAAELGERNVHVSFGYVQNFGVVTVSAVTRDVALTLSVTDEPQLGRVATHARPYPHPFRTEHRGRSRSRCGELLFQRCVPLHDDDRRIVLQNLMLMSKHRVGDPAERFRHVLVVGGASLYHVDQSLEPEELTRALSRASTTPSV